MSDRAILAPDSILIASVRLIGDVILATPLIGLFRDAWPAAAIDVLVARGTGGFLEKDPRVRRVIYADEGYARTIFRKYDLAVTLNASDRGVFAVMLAGRRQRIGFYPGVGGFRDGWKKAVMTHAIRFPFAMHVARVGQLVAEALGLPVPRLEARVFWSREEEAQVDELLRDQRVAGPFFVLHPFARWRYKYWTADRFAAVSDAVAERYGFAPLWTSSPASAEVALLGEAASVCRYRPALAKGSLSLNGMTCLLSRASLYMGLDTAISHLAASVGVPSVVLYGPTIAERWSPWDNGGPVAQQCPLPRGTQRTGRTILIQKDWECVPCGKSGCDDRGGESRCMGAITVEEVLEAVSQLPGMPEAGGGS